MLDSICPHERPLMSLKLRSSITMRFFRRQNTLCSHSTNNALTQHYIRLLPSPRPCQTPAPRATMQMAQRGRRVLLWPEPMPEHRSLLAGLLHGRRPLHRQQDARAPGLSRPNPRTAATARGGPSTAAGAPGSRNTGEKSPAAKSCVTTKRRSPRKGELSVS